MTINSYKDNLEKFIIEWNSEFHVIYLTKTMLKKSVIDINKNLSQVWKNTNFADIYMLDRSARLNLEGIIFSGNTAFKTKVSVYRPKGAKPEKRGDPRFWPYNLRKFANPGDKLVIFVVDNIAIMIVTDPEKVPNPKAVIQKVSALLY